MAFGPVYPGDPAPICSLIRVDEPNERPGDPGDDPPHPRNPIIPTSDRSFHEVHPQIGRPPRGRPSAVAFLFGDSVREEVKGDVEV